MTRHGYERDEGAFLLGLFQIALGVFIGALAAMLAHDAIVEWRARQAIEKAAAEMSRQLEKAEADAARSRQNSARMQALMNDAAARERAADEAVARALRERRERKEAAWQRFFQPSDTCRFDSSTVPCANAYMAARKRFEAQYADQ